MLDLTRQSAYFLAGKNWNLATLLPPMCSTLIARYPNDAAQPPFETRYFIQFLFSLRLYPNYICRNESNAFEEDCYLFLDFYNPSRIVTRVKQLNQSLKMILMLWQKFSRLKQSLFSDTPIYSFDLRWWKFFRDKIRISRNEKYIFLFLPCYSWTFKCAWGLK